MGLSKILLLVSTVAYAQDIIYESETDTCVLRNGGNGICKDHRLCPEAYKNFPKEMPQHCGFSQNQPVVCCPVEIDRVTGSPGEVIPLNPFIDISPPTLDFECGDSTPAEVFFPDYPEYEALPSVPLNYDQFEPEPPKEISTGPNGELLPFEQYDYIASAVGGLSARRVVAKYTVLVGSNGAQGFPEWFCTGVLINHQWVLTAAHCTLKRPIEIVRLGEHDYNNPDDGSNPIDLDVLETIIHPNFSHPIGYHDLALLKIPLAVTFEPSINPVCLPWGSAHTRETTNTLITLTGWGATQFGGLGSSILQEVNVTVFDMSVCERSYSKIRNYLQVWPQGLRDDSLCAGDPEGGKDACQGDSGGPVTYLNEANRYVLAGVVSRGYGCGDKEFPGLYANIHHAPYLAWIKQIAFQ